MSVRSFIKNGYLLFRNLLLLVCLRPGNKKTVKPTSIIVIRLDRIGDLVVSLPAIKALKDIFPEAKIAVLARQPALALLEGLAWIDEKIPYQGFWKTIQVLRSRKFSLAIDLLMDYTLKTALLVRLSGARITAGFDIAGRGRCFYIPVAPSEDKKMMSRHILDLAIAIAGFFGLKDVNIPQDIPQLAVSREADNFAQEFLRKNGVSAGDLILAIHPGAKFPSQCWPADRFARLADILNSKYCAKIIIIGSRPEQMLVKNIAGLMRITPILAWDLPLGQLAAVIARVNILICNNSGILHIAAALGIPTVSTMGPTEPDLWRPAGKNNTVIRKNLSCSPCNKAVCVKHECLESISVEEMEEAVAGVLKEFNRKVCRS